MHLQNRRDQLSYFLGFVSKSKIRQIEEAIEEFSKQYAGSLKPENVFEYCPFNDGFDQIIRSYRIYENGKGTHLIGCLCALIEEFFYLVSDFVAPCCEDGRAFYATSTTGQILMLCDRCQSAYELDGRSSDATVARRMNKHDFVARFGWNTSHDWPYHRKIGKLD